MKLINKACACVIRQDKLLVFEHPSAGFQIPKGTVEDGEKPEHAVVRELHEESGLQYQGPVTPLGSMDRIVGAGPREDSEPELHRWHFFLMQPTDALADSWTHQVTGDGEELGMQFRYFWHPLNAEPIGFHEVFVRALVHIGSALQTPRR
jgi:8-oxo-dGTP pyrophosphatase MutT (NUDIX family)